MTRTASLIASLMVAVATSWVGLSYFSSQPTAENGTESNATVTKGSVAQQPIVGIKIKEVDSVGLTVHDMDAELKFFTEVLPFKIVSDEEVVGDDFEELFGVFGCRARVVRLQLGKEFISLTQFLAPRGRPIPVDSKSNDGWFQHIAIVVSDMEQAYAHLRKHNVEHVRLARKRCPIGILTQAVESFDNVTMLHRTRCETEQLCSQRSG